MVVQCVQKWKCFNDSRSNNKRKIRRVFRETYSIISHSLSLLQNQLLSMQHSEEKKVRQYFHMSASTKLCLLRFATKKPVTLFIGTIKSEVWLLSITNKLDLSLSIFTQYHHAFFHHRERGVFNYFFHCYA